MKHYFFDSAEENLYIFDGATEEMRVLPKLKVRVIIGLTDAEDERKKNGELTGGAGSHYRASGSKRVCGNCGAAGHNRKTCPQN